MKIKNCAAGGRRHSGQSVTEATWGRACRRPTEAVRC